MGNQVARIEDLENVKINNYYMISLPKVGNHSIRKLLKNNNIKIKNERSHNIIELNYILNNESNNLFIAGIRNPLQIMISLYFQTYHLTHGRAITNKHPTGFNLIPLCKENDIVNMSEQQIINDYFSKKDFLTFFNEFMNDFFDVTKINTVPFNKERGIQLYKLKNNNYMLFYVLEKINKNTNYICNLLNIPLQSIPHEDNSENKIYNNKYNSVKPKIKYSKKYLDSILNTNIINYFYLTEDIQKMYSQI